MQITKTLENPVFSRVLFCAAFYCFKGKVADCHKKSLEKVDGYFKNSFEKVCAFAYNRDNDKARRKEPC